MPKRRVASQDKYYDRRNIVPRDDKVSLVKLAFKVPMIVSAVDKSFVKLAQEKPDWSLYRIEMHDGNPFIVREMCDRCGKVWVPPSWRKVRGYNDEDLGMVYVDTGLCKTCINASVYVDKYLDGKPLPEVEAKKLFYKYARDYEKAWRMVLKTAPLILMSEAEWLHRCEFFNGCAFCGGTIQTRAMYFPPNLDGKHVSWNVVPLCDSCIDKHYRGRTATGKPVTREIIFASHEHFNKTKTLRMYLIQQMRKHEIYIDPLISHMKRFYETSTLKGSE